jgi:hypothetical protein
MKILHSIFFVFLFVGGLYSQMVVEGDTLVGNEWIDYSKSYLKIKVAEDGVYKVTGQEMMEAGMDISLNQASYLQLWHNGKEVFINTSVTGEITDESYIEFYGEKNTIALDSFMYENWRQDLLNPKYSLISDTSVYYLTFADNNVDRKRYKTVVHNYSTNTTPPESYFYHTSALEFHNYYFKPTYRGTDRIKLSNFVSSEGFSKGLSRNTAINIPTEKIYTDENLDVSLEYRLGSNGLYQNFKEYRFNGEVIDADTTGEYEVISNIINLPVDKLKENNQFNIVNTGSTDQHMISTVAISYPRQFDLSGNSEFNINLSSGRKYFEVEGFDFGNNQVVIDPLNGRRYFVSDLGDNTKGIIIDGSSNQQIHFYAETKLAPAMDMIEFQDLNNWSPSYIIITNRKIYDTDGAERNVIQEYIDFRETTEGGNFDAEIVYTDMIYDQFGYGVPNHLHAFKNFSYWAKKNWPLEYVNIIGKGREYHAIRTNEQLADPIHKDYMVPSYGNSPSDFLLFSFKNKPNPYFAIGRIAAKNMTDAGNYFDKMKVHTAAINAPQEKDKMWLKNVLHLAGGSTIDEQSSIKSFLSQMANEIETNKFGAKTHTINKASSATVQSVLLEEVYDIISNGVSIINFFGHASVGNWGFDLDAASNYNNVGKLPFIFSLGCYSGNICTSSTGTSEDWVLTKDRGAIGYIASSGSAYLSTQGIYGKSFYASLGDEFYNESIGNMFKIVNERNKDEADIGRLNLLQQFYLHADPAVKIHGFDAPDYAIDYESIKLNPSLVQVTDSNFDFDFDIINIGHGIEDSISIRLEHYLPSGDTAFVYNIRIKSPKYAQHLSVNIPLSGTENIGKNVINVFVDETNEVNELREDNNIIIRTNGEIAYEFFIVDSGVRPVYPLDFSIVNENMVPLTLKSSTSNIFNPFGKYIIQIDTTETFDSQLLEQNIIENTGSLVAWNPTIPMIEERVYYWRVSPYDEQEENRMWQESSFVYLSDSPLGWNQSHYYQFIKDEDDYFDHTRGTGLEFTALELQVRVRSEIYSGIENIPYTTVAGQKWGSLTPFNGSRDLLNIIVWDEKDLKYNISGTDYGSINNSSNNCFSFDVTNQEGRKGVKDLLEDCPTSADIFVFFSISKANADFKVSEWAQDSLELGYNLFSTLEDYGAQQIRLLNNSGIKPYILYFKKGEEILNEVIGNDIYDVVSLTGVGRRRSANASLFSTTIGPSISWNNFVWNNENVESQDSTVVSIFVKESHSSPKTPFVIKTESKNIDLSTINPDLYPYLELEYYAKDGSQRTPPNLINWRVFYDTKPEFVINSTKRLEFYADSLYQGESFKFKSIAENINNIDGDSLLVRYTIIDDRNIPVNEFKRLEPILYGKELELSFQSDTKNMSGEYQFFVEINPGQDQEELYSFNNLGVKNFVVMKEDVNPILDVTFDGVRILDGDFITNKPVIHIKVKDENQFLLLNDPNNFIVKLKYPDTQEPIIIDQLESIYSFTPAVDGNQNEASVILRPELEDGDYTLYVSAKDASNNKSGNEEFSVDFKVLNKKTITEVFNYPNPFSTSTQFVFTLTGAVPDQFSIQIMTVTGKVVKEIRKEELGLLKIGNNISEYKWDGTDEFGEKLGNGTYFYRVLMGNQHSSFEQRSVTENNQMFKEGFGKMVILR